MYRLTLSLSDNLNHRFDTPIAFIDQWLVDSKITGEWTLTVHKRTGCLITCYIDIHLYDDAVKLVLAGLPDYLKDRFVLSSNVITTS